MQTKLFRRDFTLVVIGQIISLFGNATPLMSMKSGVGLMLFAKSFCAMKQ